MPKKKNTEEQRPSCKLQDDKEKCEKVPRQTVDQQIAELKKICSMLLDAVNILRASNKDITKALKDNMLNNRYGSYPNAIAEEE